MSLSEPSLRRSPSTQNPVQPKPYFTGFFVATSLLILLFSRPLLGLIQFAVSSDLYSYILLVPFISAYLVYSNKSRFGQATPSWRAGVFFEVLSGIVFVAWRHLSGDSASPGSQNYLVGASLSFALCFMGLFALFFGRRLLSTFSFPLGFLIFLSPLPSGVESAVNGGLQTASAETALQFFRFFGTPVNYHDLLFQLPGITFQVAPECSGIHSSLILLITSLIAAHLFLRTPWKQAILVVSVIPLAILRNAVRVFTIGELCVEIRPEMIDSYIHHHGGPIFFALSLVPFSLLLFFLWKSDRSSQKIELEPASV